MAAPPPVPPPVWKPEIGPDGIARDSPVIAYTEKVILEEQLQLKKYIQENYSKIRDVEKELENLTLEMKLTAGPKKAALEHLRKKIELSTERIRLAKVKEEHAKKAWEAAAQVVKDEEDAKQKLCDDLNRLGVNNTQHATINSVPQQPMTQNAASATSPLSNAVEPATVGQPQRPSEPEKKRKPPNTGRGRGGVMILPKGRGAPSSGWTGAGFDVDGGI
ncbi:hypothetical protein PR202_gb27464 [Eleusine coracana subsp. coracana]|uniref:RAB6-interacting golgin n=1 Tax=Eleusine coracana subsp. coracana TaxID=191504 RepID=A0AAV5FUU3_ELECO|nr:hypothetical protein PR202_gb27464 [Eleusine coracana subsp. coracana]